MNVPHDTQDLCVASILNARPPELPTMDLALAHAKELFPLPRVVLDARKAIAQQASAAKIATILGNDQTLAARVVLLSNSPAFRGRMQVRDLSQAVARVGNKNLD